MQKTEFDVFLKFDWTQKRNFEVSILLSKW